MNDPLASYYDSQVSVEHPGAALLSPTVDEILGMSDDCLERSLVNIIAECKSSESGGTWRSTEWLASRGSYRSGTEAHLQELAIWYVRHSWGEELKLDASTIVTRILNTTDITPFRHHNKTANADYIVFPTAFFKMLDDFFRGYYRGVDSGADLPDDEASMRIPNMVGGRALWKILHGDFSKCKPWIHELVSSFITHTAFPWADLLYYEHIVNAVLKVSEESGLIGKATRFPCSSRVQFAAYLVTVFTLFHELSHIAIDAMAGEEKDKQNDPISALEVEVQADSYAVSSYSRFVRDNEQALCRRGSIDVCTVYGFGPAAFFTVALAKYITTLMFKLVIKVIERDSDQEKNANGQIAAVRCRLDAVAELYAGSLSRPGAFAPHEIVQTIAPFVEIRLIEVALLMLFQQLVYLNKVNLEDVMDF